MSLKIIILEILEMIWSYISTQISKTFSFFSFFIICNLTNTNLILFFLLDISSLIWIEVFGNRLSKPGFLKISGSISRMS